MREHALPTSVGDTPEPVPAWWVRLLPRVGVSSCLLGEPVRFNGGHKRDRFLTDVLHPYVEWVPVCPEAELGLGTPRERLRLAEGDGGPRMVATGSGTDHTDDMAAYARRRVTGLSHESLCGYVLKSKSPSCGLFDLPVYAGDRPARRGGRGLFASALTEAVPRLAVEEERRLADPHLREHFVERIFAHARLQEFFAGRWHREDLLDFHARHKLQLLAHDPAREQAARRVVAAAGGRPPDGAEREYPRLFLEALAVPPSRTGHLHAMECAFELIGERLHRVPRHELLDALASYRAGHGALSAPIGKLRREAERQAGEHSAKDPGRYLRAQTYLEPFPAELGLRDHV